MTHRFLLSGLALVAASTVFFNPADASATNEVEQGIDAVTAKKARDKTAAKAKKGEKENAGGKELTVEEVKEQTRGGDKTAQNRSNRRVDRGPAQADDGTEEEEDLGLPARLPWRGSSTSWNNSVTTEALGVGSDFQSTNNQRYVQTFGLALNYWFVDQDRWSIAFQTAPSLSVELTNSDTTNTLREPQFNDLPVQFVFRRILHSDPSRGIATGFVSNNTLILPTSPASSRNGTILTTSPRVVLWQAVPLPGFKDRDFLKNFLVGGSVRWDHRFGTATTAVGGGDFVQERQNLTGVTFADDQFGINRFAQNAVRVGGFLFFSEVVGNQMIQFFGAANFTRNYLPEFSEDTSLPLDTGEARVDTLETVGL
ncbi:MAG: hypothetical protein AAGA56_27195, partial [Myxococcota bacterium]